MGRNGNRLTYFYSKVDSYCLNQKHSFLKAHSISKVSVFHNFKILDEFNLETHLMVRKCFYFNFCSSLNAHIT